MVYINIESMQEQGYSFEIDGISHLFGTMAVISADNPASSALGGFKESGSAHRYCRQCLGTSDEASTNY